MSFFFPQERWGTSLSSFPIQTTYSLASEINGTGSFQGREREKQDPSSLPPLPASLARIAASLVTQYSNPLSPGPLQQSTGDRPFPDPCVYTKIKSQGHLIHPSTAKKRRAQTWKLLPDPFLFLVQALTCFRNAFFRFNQSPFVDESHVLQMLTVVESEQNRCPCSGQKLCLVLIGTSLGLTCFRNFGPSTAS